MKKLKRLPLLLSLAMVVGLWTGCAETTTDGGDDNGLVQPKVGSSYTYTEYDTDEGLKVDSTEKSTVERVVETNMTFEGKSDVTKLEKTFPDNSTEVGYVRYLANNDIAVYFDLAADDEAFQDVESFWLTVPFGSKAPITTTLHDTDTLDLSVTVSYEGEETVTIGTEEQKVWKGKILMEGALVSGSINITFEATSLLSFLPRVGNLYRAEESSNSFGGLTGSVQQLVSYSLQQ